MRNFGTDAREPRAFIFGIRPVIEAIAAGKELEALMVQKGISGELVTELKNIARLHEIMIQFVPEEKLNRVTRKVHQGVVAYISPITYTNIENLIPQLFEEGKVPLILMLDRITDVRNFGAIARSAHCFGAHAIVLPTRGAAPVSEDAVKTSAGALLKIPICREPNLKDTLDFLKNSGLQLIACTEKATKLVSAHDWTVPTCILMGSEEDGISGAYADFCDAEVRIPMAGNIDSLNVSVSAGIILYEVLNQRISS